MEYCEHSLTSVRVFYTLYYMCYKHCVLALCMLFVLSRAACNRRHTLIRLLFDVCIIYVCITLLVCTTNDVCNSKTYYPVLRSFSHILWTSSCVGRVCCCLQRPSLPVCSHPCVDRENGQIPKEEKTAYRRCWEVYHATSGFLSIGLGLGQVYTWIYM